MAIVLSSVNDFFMAKAALSISLNALDEPDMLSASTYANAKVTAFRRDIIDYDAANNYRSWTLYAFPTYFDDHVARYCHIAIIKNGDAATVVYPPTRLDIYGRPVSDDGTSFLEWDETNEVWVTTDTEPAPDDSNFYIFLGKITSSGNDGNTPREWDSVYPFITGNLDTDQYRNEAQGDWTRMFQYNAIANEITQLLTITVSRIKTLILGSAQKPITDLQRSTDTEPADPNPNADTTIPTLGYMAAYGSRKYLSRVNDDTAQGHLTFNDGFDSKNDGVVDTNLTVGGFTGSKSFATGLLGNGWRVNAAGHGEMDSLSLRKFLEVPELRFNRTTVHVGVDWQTHGAGLIEEVIHPAGFAENRGVIKLKLEEGEYGAVALSDYCMGIFHNEVNTSANATQNVDSHNGNFLFAGFMTIYFKVVAFCDPSGDTTNPDSRNQYFVYELRPVSVSETVGWSHQHHPQPSMSFACYANPNNSERQSCVYATTDYTIMLTGMVDWTYGGNNIAYIFGHLNGFTIPAQRLVDGEWEPYNKILEGYGVAFGNAYMWGTIDQFDRQRFLVTQQIYQTALAIAPDVVLSNPNWLTDYVWLSDPQQPSPEAPYLYSYWLLTYSDSTTDTQGPVLSGFDNSLFNLRLNKEVVSAALSNWYVEGEPTDVLTFDVEATLYLGNQTCDITTARATSDITGFSYTVDVNGSVATFHITINGYVAQQVAGLLAESAYITFRCYGNTVNYAERTLSIVENRQGNDGEDGMSLATVNNYYAWGDSGTTAPTSWGAANTHPAHSTPGFDYLWNYEEHIASNGHVVSTSAPTCIGYFPEDGVGIASIREYFVLGTAAAPDPPELSQDRMSYSLGNVEWSLTPLEPTAALQYLWNVEIVEFTDGTFHVGTVHIAGVRGSDALMGDLDNEMDSIALDYEGKTSRQEQRSTRLSIYFGRTEQTLTSMSATSDNVAVTAACTQQNGAYTGEVVVTVPQNTTLTTGVNITIVGQCSLGTVTRVFTIGIVKAGRVGENAVIYQLVPSVKAIKVNGAGTYSDISLTAGVNKVDGSNVTSQAILSADTDPVAYLYYKIDNGSWTRCYTNTSISVATAQTSVKLRLIAEASVSDSYSGVIYDMETVPVVKDGANGTSISLKGNVNSSSDLPDASGYADGDAFVALDTGHLWVLVNGVWVDCGPFKGQDGTSQYIHMKYSDDGGATFTAATDLNDPTTIGETEGTYMGYYVDSNPVDSTTVSDYAPWHKIEAEDGPGQELVFFRQTDWAQEGGSTATPDIVDISQSDPTTFQGDEYRPYTSGGTRWTDDPSGVTSIYKYEFYAIRKRIGGVWQAFSAVKLWSRYAEDGDTTVFYQLVLSTEYVSVADDGNGGHTYTPSTVNVRIVQSSGSQNINVATSASLVLTYTKDGGTAQQLTISNASSGASINVSDVNSYITFMLSNGNNVIATKSCNIVSDAAQGVPGVGIAAIVEYYARSKSESAVPGNTATANAEAWSTTMSQVNADWPYLWNYEVSVGTDNQVKGQTDPAIIVRYTEDGRGVTGIKEYYKRSASPSTVPNRWASDTPSQWYKSDTAKSESSITGQGWSTTAPRTTMAEPYLWNFAAISYSKSYLHEYEPPQCVGVHGDSPIIADLDNEMDCIPVSSAGVLASAKTFTVNAKMFYGSTEQSLVSAAFSSSDNKVTGSYALANSNKTAVCTITAAAGTYSANVEFVITVTDSSGNTASKIFTIGLAKAGANGDDAIIYRLLPSVNAVKIDNAGTYSPEALTVAVNKTVGNTTTQQAVTSQTSGLYLYYSIDGGTTWTRFYTTSTINLATTERPSKNIRLRLLASASTAESLPSGTIVYDMETIPVVKDGTDATGLRADLDNEMTCFAVEDNGEYAGGDDNSDSTTFAIFYGTEAQTLTDCYISNIDERLSASRTWGANNKSATFTVSPIEGETFDGPIAVTITGVCALGEVSKVFTVTFVKGGANATIYKLMPSNSVVKVDANGRFTNDLKIAVKRTIGKASSYISSGFYCYYSITDSAGNLGTWTRWTSFGDNGYDLLARANVPATSFNIRLRIQDVADTRDYSELPSSVTVYDRETIPIVKDGVDGDDGENAINYVLEASRQFFSHTDNVGIDFRFYKSDGQSRDACIGWYAVAEYNASGNYVGGRTYSSVKAILGWRPSSTAVAKVDMYAFLSLGAAGAFHNYLRGASSTYSTEPVTSVTVTLAEPVIDLRLSQEGTITYPVDANRFPEDTSLIIDVHLLVNNVPYILSDLSVSSVLAGNSGSGMGYAGCDPFPDQNDNGGNPYCEFETIPNVAVAALMQVYRVSASCSYGGKTYTVTKDITFCAVTAGQSVQGQPGIQGCVVRLLGAWKDNICYVNESNLNVTTVRYIDVVQYVVNGTTKWYERTTYTTNYGMYDLNHNLVYQNPTNRSYWTESNNFEFIATQLLLAQNAHITFGQGNQILIIDENGNVVGGLSGFGDSDAGAYRIWFGAAQPADAPFSVKHDGSLVAANVNSQFQDVSGCYTSDNPSFDTGQLEIVSVKTGANVGKNNVAYSGIVPRVYNLLANGNTIVLNNSADLVGLRVLICNTETNVIGANDATWTQVIQENNNTFLGAGITTTYQELVNGVTVYRLGSYVPAYDVKFMAGLMEFIAIPDNVLGCRWAVINDGVSAKWYNDKMVHNNYTGI